MIQRTMSGIKLIILLVFVSLLFLGDKRANVVNPKENMKIIQNQMNYYKQDCYRNVRVIDSLLKTK